jgi:hypothetical protein
MAMNVGPPLAKLAMLAIVAVCSFAAAAASPSSVQVTEGANAATSGTGVPETIEGRTQAEWTGEWWRWAYTFPAQIAPFQDRTGRLCRLAQRGPVWFLAGTDGSFDARRRCKVPAGKYILVPVINMVHHGPVIGKGRRVCGEMMGSVAVNNDHLASAVAVLDGRNLPKGAIRRLRTSRCFDLLSDDPDAPSGIHAAADGYWLFLPPLSPGRHTLKIGANYEAPAGDPFGKMIQNFEYELIVGEPTI